MNVIDFRSGKWAAEEIKTEKTMIIRDAYMYDGPDEGYVGYLASLLVSLRADRAMKQKQLADARRAGADDWCLVAENAALDAEIEKVEQKLDAEAAA